MCLYKAATRAMGDTHQCRKACPCYCQPLPQGGVGPSYTHWVDNEVDGCRARLHGRPTPDLRASVLKPLRMGVPTIGEMSSHVPPQAAHAAWRILCSHWHLFSSGRLVLPGKPGVSSPHLAAAARWLTTVTGHHISLVLGAMFGKFRVLLRNNRNHPNILVRNVLAQDCSRP